MQQNNLRIYGQIFLLENKMNFYKNFELSTLLVKLLVKVDNSILTLKFIKMIKLVSKNPVQRFKDGQKIQKFKNPAGGIVWKTNNKNHKYYTKGKYNIFENGEVWDNQTGKLIARTRESVRNPREVANNWRGVKYFSDDEGYLYNYNPVFDMYEIVANPNQKYTMGSGFLGLGSDFEVSHPTKKNITKSSTTTNKPIVGDAIKNARRHDYKQGEVEYRKFNGKWAARYLNGNDQKWYYVAEGSTGYDAAGNYHKLENGKWVKPANQQSIRTDSKNNTQKSETKGTGYTQAAAKSSPTITYQFLGPKMQDVQGTRTDLTNDLSDADNQVNQYQLHQRGRLGTGVGWNQGYQQMFNNVNNNDDDKALLGELGLSSLPQTASELQKAMQDYAKRAGIDINGITADNFVDNKWGQQSQSAWDTLKHIITRKNKDGESMAYMTGQKQDSVVSPSVSQPYRSQYDYSRGTKGLRDLGIYDYNSMMNYVRSNPNAPFSTDLTNYLQNKYDKEYGQLTQRDIEQALDVKGRYRRGRNGDLDDINRTLSTYWSTKTPEEEPVVVNPQYSNILKNNLGEEFLNHTKYYSKYYPTLHFKKGGLISKNPVEQFREGGKGDSFKLRKRKLNPEEFNEANPWYKIGEKAEAVNLADQSEISIPMTSPQGNLLRGSSELPEENFVGSTMLVPIKNTYYQPPGFYNSTNVNGLVVVQNDRPELYQTSTYEYSTDKGKTYKELKGTVHRKENLSNGKIRVHHYTQQNGRLKHTYKDFSKQEYNNHYNISSKSRNNSSSKNISVPIKEQLRNQRIQQYKKDFKQDKTKAYINQFNTTEELQRDLNRKGFKLKVDGLYGPKTKQAVKDYLAKIAFNPNSNVGTELKWQERGIQDNFDRYKLPDFATDTHKDKRFFDSEWVTPKWFPIEQ